jgi:hypothetical protein
VTLALAVPTSVLTARLFATVFEIPFQRYRGWHGVLGRPGEFGGQPGGIDAARLQQ